MNKSALNYFRGHYIPKRLSNKLFEMILLLTGIYSGEGRCGEKAMLLMDSSSTIA
uniref:Uncharacterized protein n=1 Tax=Anguilla anguilla TaxID=7936 RepID=A0A0E9S4A9_ANGAN